eukprot:COSAG01_NODE_1800_length_9205_cov_18.778058_6_plen_83_part_00
MPQEILDCVQDLVNNIAGESVGQECQRRLEEEEHSRQVRSANAESLQRISVLPDDILYTIALLAHCMPRHKYRLRSSKRRTQ